MRIEIKETKGFSLVVVVVFVAMLSTLAIIAVKMGALTAISMYNAGEGKQAYYIAEAAFQHALFKLNQNPSWRGDLLDQIFEGGTYSINVSQANPIDDLTITAVGSYNGTEHSIVRVVLPPVKLFIIINFAGHDDGTANKDGDNGPAIGAGLDKPRGISKNSAGDVYIADSNNSVIRYVDSILHKIYKVAGKYKKNDYNCDDCNPTSAWLNKAEGVYIDQAVNIFIADTENHLVRKIIAGGNIINVAGTPQQAGPGGDGDIATSSRLDKPRDVIVDQTGNIFIADTDNCKIKKVNVANGRIYTFAGTGVCDFGGDGGPATNAKLRKPRGLAFDTSGNNLYFADTDNNRIRRVDMATNKIYTVAGTGAGGYNGDGILAVDAKLNKPRGVAINQFGTIYIADTDNHRIRKINSTDGIITTHAGTGSAGNSGDGYPALDAQLNKPNRLIAYDDVDGHLIISDTDNNRLREITDVY